MALAMRDLSRHLRETGESKGYNAELHARRPLPLPAGAGASGAARPAASGGSLSRGMRMPRDTAALRRRVPNAATQRKQFAGVPLSSVMRPLGSVAPCFSRPMKNVPPEVHP